MKNITEMIILKTTAKKPAMLSERQPMEGWNGTGYGLGSYPRIS
jgi:hypothetical protein